MVGLLEVAVSTAVTIVIDDQSEIGTASGVFGSIRAVSGVLASKYHCKAAAKASLANHLSQSLAAIYVSILQNKVKSNTKSILVPALIKAGLPLASLEPFLMALASGDQESLLKIPGVTPSILQIAVPTFRKVYALSFKTVFLATIGFSGLSFVVSFFVPDIDDKLSRDVVRRLGSVEALPLEKKQDVESQVN